MKVAFPQLYDLKIVDTRRPGWRERVMQHVGPGEPRTLGPLRAVFDVAEELGCRSVVVEPEYVDYDYLDEFAEHYCRVFADQRAKCSRVHFFRGRVRRSDFLGRLDQRGYLGFSVLRPTFSFRTGRTVLSSPRHDGNSMFTLCRVPVDVNLLGTKLTVEGTPYIQQDTNVGVCAQASLWMAALYMHIKYGYPRYMPSQITEAATRSLTVGPVRVGLAPYQMLEALRDMGFAPRRFPNYEPSLTARTIYAYVESELPVIVALQLGRDEGHAVLAIGHDFRVHETVPKGWDSNVQWIDRFFIHDDAVKPYADLAIAQETPGLYSMNQVAYTIVLAPREVVMHADDVFVHLDTLRQSLARIFSLFDIQPPSQRQLDGLVFRTYLQRSNDFKTELPEGMSEGFKHVYRSMRMPRYLWVTEISRPEHLNVPSSEERKRLGEIVMDSTADRHARLRSYLAIHFLGRMIVRSGNYQRLYLDDSERPYGHRVRRAP